MRIGLISDTHVPEAGERLPGQVYDLLAGVDLVLHAGDMHIIDVLDWLERIAPVVGARGNGDGDGFRPPFPDDDPRVKPAHVLELEGLRVGLVHGHPLPGETPWISQDALMERHFGGRVDVLVCGDTHIPHVATSEEGVLIVNPGSPALPRNVREPGTVGILTIEGGAARAEILRLTSLAF
jgi:putative phosphoesterase